MKIRTDDNVIVVSGKDKGKSGKVIRVDRKRSRVYVEGLNIVKRHQRANPARANAPVGVIVDEAMVVLQFRGKTGTYLEPAPGIASLDLLRMLREGLLAEVRAAITKAKAENAPVVREGLRVVGSASGGVEVRTSADGHSSAGGQAQLERFERQLERQQRESRVLVDPDVPPADLALVALRLRRRRWRDQRRRRVAVRRGQAGHQDPGARVGLAGVVPALARR